MPEQLSAADLALIEEAAKKSGLVWLAPSGPEAPPPPEGAPRALWHVWHDGAVTFVAGGREQPLPPYATPGKTVVATFRSKDTWGRLISFTAQIQAPTPGTPDWQGAATALHAERLNLPEGDAYLDRWTTTSIVLRLRPVAGPLPLPEGSGAARPVPTPAATLGLQPKMVGGVTKDAKKDRKAARVANKAGRAAEKAAGKAAGKS